MKIKAILLASVCCIPTASFAEIITSGVNLDWSAKEYTSHCDKTVESIDAAFSKLEKDETIQGFKAVMTAHDQIIDMAMPFYSAWYMKSVHADESIRDAATGCSQKLSDFFSRVGLSTALFNKVSNIEQDSLNKVNRHLVSTMLTDFRRSGVDKDEKTRERIQELNSQITQVGNEFSKNIRDDVRSVIVDKSELAGLPQDYIDNKAVDENGKVTITTDYPDLYPVMTYAESDELRRKLRVASRSRGYPQNLEVLNRLLELRYELAQVLGYDNFAQLAMDGQMIQTPENATKFLNKISKALVQPLEREKAIYLKRLQKIDPQAKEVREWQVGYLENLIRQEDYSVDAKAVREYFQYENVRQGIFDLTEQLFGVKIEKWETDTWHEDVESYQIKQDGKLIARFYMDNHPREGKYKHAAAFTLRPGIKGKQIPLSGLAQNFPKGLMEHGQVETFLHEFGHLLHGVFSGQHEWYGVAGLSMESDFVEAPSQMLEEWIWDYDTLKTFALNKEGKAIPKSLVDKMVAARDFGQATGTATQVYYAQLSLQYYDRDPKTFKLQPKMLELHEQYAPFPYTEGTHFYTNFGHLYGYSAKYYTYQWSLAISKDLFSRFEKAGMNNKQVAQAYRDKVLAAGGSLPADEFIEDFLGRPFTVDAYIESLKAL